MLHSNNMIIRYTQSNVIWIHPAVVIITEIQKKYTIKHNTLMPCNNLACFMALKYCVWQYTLFVFLNTQSKSQLIFPCSACHDDPAYKCIFSCPSAENGPNRPLNIHHDWARNPYYDPCSKVIFILWHFRQVWKSQCCVCKQCHVSCLLSTNNFQQTKCTII